MASNSTDSGLVIDQTTIFSLFAALTVLIVAYATSLRVLHPSTTIKLRILYIWHMFDALIHFFFESFFLYHSFFTYRTLTDTNDYPHPASLTSPNTYFLGRKDRQYGCAHGTAPTARLWQEYAKSDRRWAHADTTVVGIELLTVFGAGPLALLVCELIRRRDLGARLWFWATVLATGVFNPKFDN